GCLAARTGRATRRWPPVAFCGGGRISPGEACEAVTDCPAAHACVNCQCVGTGDVSVQLLWSDNNDLDLHVTDPNGLEIGWTARMSPPGGQLDHGPHRGCGGLTDGPVENIFWPTGSAPAGAYTVRVTLYNYCGDAPAQSPFTVRTLVDGVPTEYTGVVNAPTLCKVCSDCGSCTFVTTFTH